MVAARIVVIVTVAAAVVVDVIATIVVVVADYTAATVELPGNLVLLSRIRNHLLVAEHELDAPGPGVGRDGRDASWGSRRRGLDAVVIIAQLDKCVVPHCGSESVLLGGISVARILARQEVILDALEAALVVRVFLVVAQVPAVDDGVDEVALGLRLEIAAPGHPPDALEAQRIPDAARRHVGLVNQVENRVCVAQQRRPLQVALAHQLAHAPVPRAIGDDEAGIAHMRAAARIIWLDIEAAQTQLVPAGTLSLPSPQRALPVFGNVAEHHDGGKVLEPVAAKRLDAEGSRHWVRVATLNLAVHLRAQVLDQRQRHAVRRAKWNQGRLGRTVSQRHGLGHDGRGQGRRGVRERRSARLAIDGWGGRVVKDGRHDVFCFLALSMRSRRYCQAARQPDR
ncbi:hypothetical protein BKA81DRAFT_352066 [Phyllosticta paracitricarpa]